MFSNSDRPIRIMTVDDHPVFRDGIGAMIAAQEDMELVAEASTGRGAVELFSIHRPDITLTDLRLPDISGLEAITQIRQRYPEASRKLYERGFAIWRKLTWWSAMTLPTFCYTSNIRWQMR